MDKDFLKQFTWKDPYKLVTKPSNLLKMMVLFNFITVLGCFLVGYVFNLQLVYLPYYIQGVGLGVLYLLSLRVMPKKVPLAFLMSVIRMFAFAWVICELGQKQPWPVLLVFLGCFSYKGVIFLYALWITLWQATCKQEALKETETRHSPLF